MSTSNLARSGLVGVVAGLAGAAVAVVMLFWPAHSTAEEFRYPFTTMEFLVFQGLFFLQHVGLLVLLLALALSGAAGGRAFRVGAWLAVLGMVVFSFVELAAMGYADSGRESVDEGWIGGTYGLASVATGLGLVVAGGAIARAHRWSGWRRWAPLATGVCLFVVVIPGLFAGFVGARLVIAVWMLLFAAVGWSLHVESHRAAGGDPPRVRALRGGPVSGIRHGARGV